MDDKYDAFRDYCNRKNLVVIEVDSEFVSTNNITCDNAFNSFEKEWREKQEEERICNIIYRRMVEEPTCWGLQSDKDVAKKIYNDLKEGDYLK